MENEITIRYYNVYITRNGTYTNVSFNAFIKYVFRERFKSTDSTNLYLKQMKFDNELKKASNLALSFADYRDVRKPKSGKKGTDEYNTIEEDVFEDTNCYYVDVEKLFICEYNYYGAKISAIKKYLKTFLIDSESDTWDIEFLEITPEYSMKDVLMATEFSKIEFQLDLTSTQIDILKDNLNIPTNYTDELDGEKPKEESIVEYIKNTLQHMLTNKNLLGGGVIKLIFSRSKYRKNFDTDSIKSLLLLLDEDSAAFQEISLSFKDKLGKTHENVNLKNLKVLTKKINAAGDSWTMITREMEEYFYNEGPGYYLGAGKDSKITKEGVLIKDYPFQL